MPRRCGARCTLRWASNRISPPNKIRPLSNAIYYKQPLMQHWVVEKEALTARGRFPRSVVRPPFQPLRPEHIEGIRQAVAAAGLAPLA